MVYLVDCLLRDHCGVCSVKLRLEARGWLQCDLDAHLEQANWKASRDLTGDPEPVVFINFAALGQGFFYLTHVVDAEVTVLEDNPATMDESSRIRFTRNPLLTLAHRNLVRWILFPPLSQLVYHAGWVCASREKINYWLSRS